MSAAALKPEQAFAPAHSRKPIALAQSQFDFDVEETPNDEQCHYKALIHAKLKAEHTYEVVAQRLGISKQALHKCIRGSTYLSADRRDRIFELVGIDHVRAKICVVFLGNSDLYDDFSAKMLSEAAKALYCQIEACRSGIQLEVKPGVVHELMRRGMEMLLNAQEEIMARQELRLFEAP